jgi:superfamily I DNA/RNA helicase
MIKSSKEQLDVINAELKPLYVIACAGSGKTKTAVKRVAKIREDLKNSRGYVALLSFSNVAVNTFKKDYISLQTNTSVFSNRVIFDTLDSFLTQYILLPHGHSTMKCASTPFLIEGIEPFLQNEKYKFNALKEDGDEYPIQPSSITKVCFRHYEGKWQFVIRTNQNGFHIVVNGKEVTEALGAIGAYTHNFGKYWAVRSLQEQTGLLKVLSRRFPHIIVDEAQDLDCLHQHLLKKLSDAGTVLSLIGDPAQAIFEFTGANGEFLNSKEVEFPNNFLPLSKNYRSTPKIQDLASLFSKRNDRADRKETSNNAGLFYSVFKPREHNKLVEKFILKVKSCDLELSNSAVLCRSVSQLRTLNNISSKQGQSSIALLLKATVERDVHKKMYDAFKLVCSCLVGLLDKAPEDTYSLLVNPQGDSRYSSARLGIWKFIKSPELGLPSGTLDTKSQWHPSLLERIIELLQFVGNALGLATVTNIRMKLARRQLPEGSLVPIEDRSHTQSIRIDTVHQAKGQSLDAVLYFASKVHIEAMLAGIDTEVGRIGYVALTRARDLFVLSVPVSAKKELIPKLEKLGFGPLDT